MSNDTKPDRRRVLKASGLSLAGLLGFSGVASANPGQGRNRGKTNPGQGRDRGKTNQGPPAHSNAPNWVKVKHERLKLDITKSEWNKGNPDEVAALPDRAQILPYKAMADTIQDFNDAISSGMLDLQQRNGRAVVSVEE